MSTNTVKFPLGAQSVLQPLFPYLPAGIKLTDLIALGINQTLLRDGNAGSWAQVYVDKKSQVQVSITSPDPKAGLGAYSTCLPAFFTAVGVAFAAYTKVLQGLSPAPTGISFLHPFGLAMANTKSVQLLHYPPTETLSYMDYLYSPTNRRWESLLLLNGGAAATNSLLETITDIIPIAANGGSAGSAAIAPFMGAFDQYISQMLQVFLRNTKGATQPVVAYGGPVLTYCEAAFKPNDINPATNGKKDKNKQPYLSPMSLFMHPFLADGTLTPVLCTNHPSLFMYYPETSAKYPTNYKTVLLQDLTAARWQVQMSASPTSDPKVALKVLQQAEAYWSSAKNKAAFQAIFDSQVAEFTDGPEAPKKSATGRISIL